MSLLEPFLAFLTVLFGVNFAAASALIAATTTSTATSTAQIADAPPTISAFVKSANELHPTTIYAGLRAYYSVQASDDNGLASVTVNAPGMKYSSADNTICSNGAKTCSEPVYIIVPSTPGSYTITVRATDTAGQITTELVTFTAQGCIANSECGGTYFPSSGATFCGPSGAARWGDRMKYGVVAVCSAGTCDEKTEPAVLESCAATGKMCGFSPLNGGQFQCVPIPSADCALDVSITSSCICGSGSYESYGRCCLDASGNRYHTSSYSCPIVPAPLPSLFPNSTPTSTPSTTSVPGAGAPEPSTNEAGVWAQVDVASSEIVGTAICTRSVCGINGEWHGYVPPPVYSTGSVWWPTSKRYIWQISGQAGYGSGTFNFNTYVFTVQGGTIYNGQFTATIATPTSVPTSTTTPTYAPTATSTQTWNYTAPLPVPVYTPTSTIYTPAPSIVPITIPPFFPTSTSTLTQPIPAQSAPIAQCLQAGGVWCYTESPQSNVGYCATAQAGCERKPETPQAEERRAELRSQEKFFAERRAILQDLRSMERLVRQDIVDVDAKLLKAYKEKLLALKPGEEQDLSALQNYREKITELRGDEEVVVLPSVAVDPRAEAKALKKMKQGLRQFERYITRIDAKVKGVEKAGIAVDASTKEAIVAAKTMAKQVKDAKTYDGVRDIAEDMPDVGQALNDALPHLEELLRLPRIFAVLDKKIVEAERGITQTRALVKKLKLDVTNDIAEMQTLLSDAKDAIRAVKAGGAETDDLASEMEEAVLSKLENLFDLAAHIKTVGSIRQAVTRAATDAKRYESHIRRLKKAKKDTEMVAASELLKQFDEQRDVLKALSKEKLTQDTGEQIIDAVRALAETRDDLDTLLNLSKPDQLETEIRQLFSASGEKLTPFDVEKLEQGVL